MSPIARPLIAICGTTGVGKSKLAIQLALHLAENPSLASYGFKGARVINADAMQVYAGMDIITNKVPLAEQQGVEHLLMGFKQPGDQYVVGQWVQDAIQLIEESHQNMQVPIIVGGTTYWIQHLLFPGRLSSENGVSPSSTSINASKALQTSLALLPHELLLLFENLPDSPPSATDNPDAASQLHSLLTALDPIVAKRWHWRDTRKVHRSLSIIKEMKRLPSEIISEQSSVSEPLRYPTLCFWIASKLADLEPRLNERVDWMIEQGLLTEITTLHDLTQTQKVPVDYSLGIYQSIGYKEFHDYLSSAEPSDEQFRKAVQEMKTSTKRYAKRQISWIRNKLLPAFESAEGRTAAYLLDATDLNHWERAVQDPAVKITRSFLEGTNLPDPRSLSALAQEMLTMEAKATDPVAVLQARQRIVCQLCTTDPSKPVMIEEGREWDAHTRTKSHKRRAYRETPEGQAEQERVRKHIEQRLTNQRSSQEGSAHA